MATKYVWSGATGTASGDDWTNAYTTFAAALATSPDRILIHNAHSEAAAVDGTTWTFLADCAVLCVDKNNSDALSTGAAIGSQTGTAYGHIYAGAFNVYFYGISFANGATGSKTLNLGDTDGMHFEYENCTIAFADRLRIGESPGSAVNSFVRFTNCTFKCLSTGAYISPQMVVEFESCTLTATGSAPSKLFSFLTSNAGTYVKASGCNFAHATTDLVNVAAVGNTGTARFEFRQCKIGAGVDIYETATNNLNLGNTEVVLYDCSSGDTHYAFYHENPLGATSAVTTYVCNDGASTNSTSISWQIVSSANATFFMPYRTPWISTPHTGTSAVTLAFEGLRVDSTTVIQNDEVWGEWQYKGASGEVTLTTVNDRATPAVTPSGADQTSAKTYSDWTGSPTATDAGDSTFKLVSASVTPAESGHIFGRVCVGAASLTVYIDPQIRVA